MCDQIIKVIYPKYSKHSNRDAARFSNPGGQAVVWWAKSAPLVIIGLTELPNSRWAKAHPDYPLAASLSNESCKSC